MVHVPTLNMVTVEPKTVQTLVVVEVNVTGNPELAVANTENGAAEKATFGNAAKVIV